MCVTKTTPVYGLVYFVKCIILLQGHTASSGVTSSTNASATTTTTASCAAYSNGNSSPLSEVTEVEVRVDPMLYFCDDISNDAVHSASTEPSSEIQNEGIQTEDKTQNNNVKLKT